MNKLSVALVISVVVNVVTITLLLYRGESGRSAVSQRLSTHREELHRVTCASNLKSLYTFSMLYADRRDRHFPHSPDGSIASLQALVAAYPDDLSAQVFYCHASNDEEASRFEERLVLTHSNCSYEVPSWRLSTTERGAIAIYDKAPHHRGGRNVVLTDGSVTFLQESEFQKRIQADRERFAK